MGDTFTTISLPSDWELTPGMSSLFPSDEASKLSESGVASYSAWSAMFLQAAATAECDGILTGSISVPVDDAKLRTWRKANNFLLSMMMKCVSADLVLKIAGRRPAKDVWDILEREFSSCSSPLTPCPEDVELPSTSSAKNTSLNHPSCDGATQTNPSASTPAGIATIRKDSREESEDEDAGENMSTSVDTTPRTISYPVDSKNITEPWKYRWVREFCGLPAWEQRRTAAYATDRKEKVIQAVRDNLASGELSLFDPVCDACREQNVHFLRELCVGRTGHPNARCIGCMLTHRKCDISGTDKASSSASTRSSGRAIDEAIPPLPATEAVTTRHQMLRRSLVSATVAIAVPTPIRVSALSESAPHTTPARVPNKTSRSPGKRVRSPSVESTTSPQSEALIGLLADVASDFEAIGSQYAALQLSYARLSRRFKDGPERIANALAGESRLRKRTRRYEEGNGSSN